MGHIGNNILTVLMKEKSIGLQEAADYTGRHFKNLLDQFLNCKANLPSFGPKWDPVVAHSIMAMEAWVVGNLEWSFDVQRYFGRQHSQIKQTLIVDLYPKRG